MALMYDHLQTDTIAAIATAMSEAGIGIIRVSGPDAAAIGSELYRTSKKNRTNIAEWRPGTIRFGYIVETDESGKESLIDEVMLSWMKSPHSYTTEDTVEINTHGGMFLMNRILELVLKCGARMAEPGEFTKRAFLGGRIDLARAEAVMDLISSGNEFARKTSAAQLEGAVSARIRELRTRQTSLSSMLVSSNAEVIRVLEEQANTLTVEIDQAKQRLKEIRNELSRYGQIEDLTQRDREVTNGLADCLQKIDNTKDGIAKTKEKIKASEAAIATLNDKIRRTATTDTDLQLAIKKAELCEDIHAIFEEGISAYRDKLKQDVERDATELFLLICSDPDYTSLKINDNYGLDIVHRSGRIVPQRSAGYEHIVALSLIGALHKNAPMNGPVIMDSPFGRLSKTHKENVIKALPKMAEQVVLLAYSGEIDAQTARLTLGSDLKQEYKLDKISSFHTEITAQ